MIIQNVSSISSQSCPSAALHPNQLEIGVGDESSYKNGANVDLNGLNGMLFNIEEEDVDINNNNINNNNNNATTTINIPSKSPS